MSRILLVDDSPHAQRMGERILSEEGYEVVTVSNADSALIRLEDVDPDVILADTVMPGRSGYEICQFVKMSPRHKHVRVILTAGVLESLDEAQSRRVEADATLKKPFEASALIAAVKPLADAAAAARKEAQTGSAEERRTAAPLAPVVPFIAVVDAEQVRAAVTVALDAAMEKMVDEISSRVLETFKTRRPAPEAVAVTAPMALSEPPHPAAPPAPPAALAAHGDTIRRVHPLRLRTGSILGLDLNPLPAPETGSPEPETPAPATE
jgi:CheY-like chemotaxis protein